VTQHPPTAHCTYVSNDIALNADGSDPVRRLFLASNVLQRYHATRAITIGTNTATYPAGQEPPLHSPHLHQRAEVGNRAVQTVRVHPQCTATRSREVWREGREKKEGGNSK
jgi:hypothetical protein